MLTAAGWMLIDWDTALVAPPERDLWSLDPGDGSILSAYADATGVRPRASMIELYRIRWDLADIASGREPLPSDRTREAAMTTSHGTTCAIWSCVPATCLNGRRALVPAHELDAETAGCWRQGRISGGAATRGPCGSCRRR